LGAGRVIAIDRIPERLTLAEAGGAQTIDYTKVENINEALGEFTSGRGPDSCMDAVGMEAHAPGAEGFVDRVKQFVKVETDRPAVLRDVVMSVRNGGSVSVPGVYGGFVDTFPMGSLVNRGLTLKSGQTHVQRYWGPLLARIEAGENDPSFVITHRLSLDDAATGFDMFKHKKDDCIKVVMTP
jgi:threonine dehydrogenase-like Zn-dependent dehydrogenase